MKQKYKKKLGFCEFLYLKVSIFIKFTVGTNYKLFIILLLCAQLFTFYFIKNSIEKKYIERLKNIAESIALIIKITEDEMEKVLISTAFTVQEKALHKPLTQKDIIILANNLNINSIGILNGNTGKYELSSSTAFDKNNQFYKELSLLNINQCETQACKGKPCRKGHEIENCKIKRFEVLNAITNHEVPFIIPMMQVTLHSNNSIKAPAKWVIMYNKKLDKIIDIFYTKQEITTAIENTIKIYNQFLNYINLTDNKGNLILESGIKNKESLQISIPLNKTWQFKINGQNINYSYILNAEFSKKELQKELIIIKILFFIIATLTLCLVLVFKKKLFIFNKFK